MNNNLELVEKLVEKTGLSFSEAKNALENADWDILEAMINLESEGRIKTGQTAEYTTKSSGDAEKEKSGQKEKFGKKTKSENYEEYRNHTTGICELFKKLFDKGNSNNIEIFKDGDKKLGMPVSVFVLLLIFGFWITIPLMIVGLFFGFRYRFSGPDLGKDTINKAMGKATDVAESIKNEIKNSCSEN